jgi:integration host factor subunit alpha
MSRVAGGVKSGLTGGIMSETLTRQHLAEAVYAQVGLSRNESADLVDRVLEEVSARLIRGETVKLSSFGTFAVRSKGGRIGRNPKTGEEVPISPRRVLVFRASHVLKSMINEGLAQLETGTPASNTTASDTK